MQRATPDSPRMFESDLIDFFSRTHWSIVPILYVPAAIYLFWFGLSRADVTVVASLGLFAGGVLTWSIIEYWLHRTFFHWQPEGRWGERFHFLVHGVHHNWPKDKYRLVMPPAVSISLFWVFFGLFWLALGSRWVWPFHAGFVVGYMSYDVTHYYVHHYNPKTRYGLALKKHHMLHHFKDHSKRFGVSSMLWDYVFGTKS
jgi:sterol desaturase/sphingolipid hydroxylase (fatty acid hydroxylase superfamily)